MVITVVMEMYCWNICSGLYYCRMHMCLDLGCHTQGYQTRYGPWKLFITQVSAGWGESSEVLAPLQSNAILAITLLPPPHSAL